MKFGYTFAVGLLLLGLAGCGDLTYDATAPQVAVVYPVAWTTLARDTVIIRADAYDNHQLDRVVFFVNGESLAAVTAEPYAASWYPDTLGGHTIHCVAYDAAGNETHTDPIIVTVDGTGESPDIQVPFVSLVRPAAWSVIRDTSRIEAIAGDNRGVARLRFYLDGDSLATLDAAPWTYYWNTRAAGNGYHTLYATAADSSGNLGYSIVITVDIQNLP